MDQPALICGLVALGGLWVSLIAYGVVGPPPGQSPATDRAREKFGPFNRVAGPLTIVAGLVGLVTRLTGLW
jgi:hypothetical protein